MHFVQSKAKSRPDTYTFLRMAWSITEWLQRDIKWKINYFKASFKIKIVFFSSLTDAVRSQLSSGFLGKSGKYFGLEENKHNLTTGLSMIIWKTSTFSELLHISRNVLKMIRIVDPWFEQLCKRDMYAVRVWFRNVTNFPNINITWQVSVCWLQWLLLQGDLLLLWSGSNMIPANVHSTAEKVIRETELQLPKTEELFL